MELMKELSEKSNQGESKLQKLELNELGEVAGGFQQVSDPIYSLTNREQSVLKSMPGIKLERTNSGNYRVKYSNGTTIEPHVLSWMCKTIDTASKKR